MLKSVASKSVKSIVRLSRVAPAQVFPIGVSGVNFNNTDFDTHDQSNLPAAPTVTVRHSGFYRIDAVVNFNVAVNIGDINLIIWDSLNGNTAYNHSRYQGIMYSTPKASSVVYLRAGDNIIIYIDNATGGVLTSNTNVGDVYMIVERLRS